jgi:hypothetical protein
LEIPLTTTEAATPQAKAVTTEVPTAQVEESATAQAEPLVPVAEPREPLIAQATVVDDAHQPFPKKVGNVEFKDGRHWLHVQHETEAYGRASEYPEFR